LDNLFFQESLFGSEKIYTVLELNEQVREVLRSGFPRQVWVCGEIQNLRIQRGKNHMYFSLVQKDPDSDNIIAQVEANLFAGARQVVEKRIKEARADFELRNDIEVKFLCEVDLYTPRGKYNINIKDIDSVYTLGKVAQNRLKIIEELKKRNLLDKNKALTIPAVPLKIGLITAYDSAAYHDFINELKISGFSFRVLAVNSHMQGKMVEKDVLRALNFFSSATEVDVVVITRGGGSTADLSYFDNRKIAEAIAFLNLPVISALGHQIDTTITDMVANTMCKTPTKAAQLLVEKVKAAVDYLEETKERIFNLIDSLLVSRKRELHTTTVKIESLSSLYFRDQREELLEKKHEIVSILKVALTKNKAMLEQVFEGLETATQRLFKNSKDCLRYSSEKIKLLDPKNTLRRGYSITRRKGRVIKSIGDVCCGDNIETIVADGAIQSQITGKENEHE